MSHHHSHSHNMPFFGIILSVAMLAAGLFADHFTAIWSSSLPLRAVFYAVAFAPVGFPVVREAVKGVAQGRFADEFMLMSVASAGAFLIGEYPEAVAVMLLYSVGEALQDKAVDKARGSIKSLMEFRPDKARRLYAHELSEEVSPEEVRIGDTIEVRPGERVPLDGTIQNTDEAQKMSVSSRLPRSFAFNTAALTGESVPRMIETGGEVLAGMIAVDSVVRIEVTRLSGESAISRILNMVQEAAGRKAPTELFIHRFARIYTPVVMLLALFTVLLPWFWSLAGSGFAYAFAPWLHRALVFLVVSCPCALVVSVPLSYFGGIGAASRRGILFKGGCYMDALTEVDTVVFDKTGTLTTGEFRVAKVDGLSPDDLQTVSCMELSSSHPVAKAINRHCPPKTMIEAENIAGGGLRWGGWVVGTLRFLESEGISCPESLRSVPETIVACAKNGVFIGYILLADTLRPDARQAVERLDTHTLVLSGDKQAMVDKVVAEVGMEGGFGDLMPQDKVAHIDLLRKKGRKVAFVGDGINDAPVLALADVGVAMGGAGTDMAVETADVVLRTDSPSKVAEAISISRHTRLIVKQNIVLAVGVKLAVMLLGVLGMANLWQAVFADTGVALLAVLNSTRIFMKKGHTL